MNNKILAFIKYHWRRLRHIRWIILVSFIAIYVLVDSGHTLLVAPDVVNHSEYRQDLENGNIDTVYYSSNKNIMRYTLFTDYSRGLSMSEREYYQYPPENWKATYYPGGKDFRADLLEHDVRLVIKVWTPTSIRLLYIIGVAGLYLIIVYILLRLSGVGSLNDSVITEERKLETRFTDVIGHEEVIDDLEFIVNFMRNPAIGKQLGATIPRGLLFTGPPGTGKTLLARALAGECGVPFYYMNASSFIEMYVGTGAKRVRKLFKKARKNLPCVVFIDEIDAIGGKREGETSTSEHRQTLNALLQEMDGFKQVTGLLVLAATNHEKNLDKALLRSGRFDREITISQPRKWQTRLELFKHYLADKPLEENIPLETLARSTPGFTGADINTVVNEAAILAIARNQQVISKENLEEAVDRRLLKGNRVKAEPNQQDQLIVRYHESGHAVMRYLVGSPISRISVVGVTSGVGGMVLGEEEEGYTTKKKTEDRIRVLYSGRWSEAIKFGFDEVSVGAFRDIADATELLLDYVSVFGFNEDSNALLDWSQLNKNNNAHEVIKNVQRISTVLSEDTHRILKENFHLVEALAEALIDNETLTASEIEDIFVIAEQEHKASKERN